MIEDAELVEGTKTIIEGRAEWLMRQNVCKVKLTSKTLAWVAKYPDNGKFNKAREYPLESVQIGITRGNNNILFKELGRLTIYLNKNSSPEKKEWTIQFPPKMNKDLEDFLSQFRLLRNHKVQTDYYERNKKIAQGFEKRKNYSAAIEIWTDLNEHDKMLRLVRKQVEALISEKKFSSAIDVWEKIGSDESIKGIMQIKAKEREEALDFTTAIEIWEELGEIKEAARVRQLYSEMSSVKVSQKVVHGDDITKTEIKDSVVSKSNIGSGGGGKFAKLEKLTEMKKEGLISNEEYEKMKLEIIG
tara:strand:+ start:216 stop:1121 length:906 start_codon:yes stop_codon:yes gene_type:complete